MTEWFYDDDDCWIAECEACAVPMVVWRVHDPTPPDDVKASLWARLVEVTTTAYDFDPWIDDHMRSIPTHYHAHARPRDAYTGHGRRRRGDRQRSARLDVVHEVPPSGCGT
jgi:hypothetical protein